MHRRHYIAHLIKYEFLYQTSPDEETKTAFVYEHETDIKRLQVFTNIYEEEPASDEDNATYEKDAQKGQLDKSHLLDTSKDSQLTKDDEEIEESSPQNKNSKCAEHLFSQLLMIQSSHSESNDFASEQSITSNDDEECDISLSSIGLDFVSFD